jgi:16S rRNA (guanine527-N7)-methyltransferase
LAPYVALLAKWNKVYNLTAVRDPQAMWAQHIDDSLAALQAVEQRLAATHAHAPRQHSCALQAENGLQPNEHGRLRFRVLDVGSGGGLPGVVWAAARPDWQVTCVDAVAKKAAFINQAAAELGLPNLRAVHSRVEVFHVEHGFDLVTSRAFASLADFARLTRHLLAPGGAEGAGGRWVALKGRHSTADSETQAELRDLAATLPGVQVEAVEPLTVPGLGAERCLVWMKPG